MHGRKGTRTCRGLRTDEWPSQLSRRSTAPYNLPQAKSGAVGELLASVSLVLSRNGVAWGKLEALTDGRTDGQGSACSRASLGSSSSLTPKELVTLVGEIEPDGRLTSLDIDIDTRRA